MSCLRTFDFKVCIGRPVLWGLHLDGQKGVELTLELLKKELDLAMALSGCTNVQKIGNNLVKNVTQISKM